MKHHAVALPFCGQGHLNPLMRLCKMLALQGFTITFVNIDPVHYRIQEIVQQQQQQQQPPENMHDDVAAPAAAAQSSTSAAPAGTINVDVAKLQLDIRRAHVPVEGLDLREDFRLSLERLLAAQQGIAPHVETLLQQLKEQGSPATCIICDYGIIGPGQEVATKFNIPWIVLYTCNASMQLLSDYVTQGSVPADKAGRSLSIGAVLEVTSGNDQAGCREQVFCEGLPGLPNIINKCDVPSFKHVVDNNKYTWEYIGQALRRCKSGAHAMLFNSYEDLEGTALRAMSEMWSTSCTSLPAYAVGPLIDPLEEVEASTSLWKEDEGCMQWLDQQPARSVLYISYGSFTLLSEEQLEEVAAGLLSSQQRFLWAFRPDLQAAPAAGPASNHSCTSTAAFPGRILSQAQKTGRGYVVEWAPQLRVLSHSAVGGFLTHCGWNSVMEAISQGVPMLCWPYFADQSLDAKYVADVWKIGLYFESVRKGCLVQRSEMESTILRLMHGDDGHRLRHNILLLQEAGRQALLPPSGSSFLSVQRLIQSLEASPRLPLMTASS